MDIKLNGITKEYLHEEGCVRVLDNLSIHIPSGSFASIIGPSGCGKTTLLKIIGGFDGASKPSRDIFMIFQDANQLFPWRTLGSNLCYAIQKAEKGIGKDRAEEKTREVLSEVGLLEFYQYYPHQLSGGMKQRGALARALAVGCKVLLMDEPFTSLDRENKEIAYELLLKIWKEKELTVLFVTHDLEEAKRLSGQILYFEDLNGKSPA
ncbi:MAG TPA: ATP-binding cassette domain-containing protein [Bacillota bacterium]|nr:ATP-binding cassette domain-containing protein [Bacillota bacterium]